METKIKALKILIYFITKTHTCNDNNNNKNTYHSWLCCFALDMMNFLKAATIDGENDLILR